MCVFWVCYQEPIKALPFAVGRRVSRDGICSLQPLVFRPAVKKFLLRTADGVIVIVVVVNTFLPALVIVIAHNPFLSQKYENELVY